MTKGKRRHRALRVVLIVLCVFVAALAAALGVYAWRNTHYQTDLMQKVWKAGYVEKQATTEEGALLNYAEGGNADGTPILLLHGQQVAWEDYATVLPAMAEKYHVFAVDCHGHGSSAHDADRYTCEAMTRDFVWFVQNVIGEKCLISGHSSGGVLAACVAASAPDWIDGLLLEDPPFFCFEPEEMREKNAFVWIDGFQVMDDFLHQSDEDSFAAYYFRNGYIWPKFGGFADMLAQSAKAYERAHPGEGVVIWYMPPSVMNAMYYLSDYDLAFGEAFHDGTWFPPLSQEDVLRGIKCPTVYLKAKTVTLEDGTLTCANTAEDAERVASLIEDCETITLDSNAHDIHFVNKDAFLDGLARLAS